MPAARDSLLVWYATPEELREAWARDLVLGALFVATSSDFKTDERVRVVIELPFCEGSVDIEGCVVGSISSAMEGTGATPGVAVQTDLPIEELRGRLQDLTGLRLPDKREDPALGDTREPRYSAEAPVAIELDGRRFNAKTVDVSYNGMLALLPGIDLGEGSELAVTLSHPKRDESLVVKGQVARQTCCDHGIMAVGIRFNYGFDRIDEVTGFIDDLRGFDRARKLMTITGSLRKTRLEHVLETFTSVANQGTLLLSRGTEEGKIAYREAEIVYVVTGLVSGTKALGRMFSWTDAHFEFQSEVDSDLDLHPVPLDSATLTAAIERDELARLEISQLICAESLALDEARYLELKSELSLIQCEVAENASMGFPPAALLDILPESDTTIYAAMVELIDAGVLHPG